MSFSSSAFAEEKKEEESPEKIMSSNTRSTGNRKSVQRTQHLSPISEKPVDSSRIYESSNPKIQAPKSKQTSNGVLVSILLWVGTILRMALMDIPLMLLFALYAASVVLHKIHDEYLMPQITLMRFGPDNRDYRETTYYHRHCDADDISASSIDELVIDTNTSAQDAMEHMMTHGVSMYQNLLTPETAWELREFIDKENKEQEGWYVIENEYRYSWGIDVSMHPSIQKYWKELASNEQLVKSLQAIVGPDPAIIEFTAITSAYGAKDQHDHQDVVPPGSGAKFARSFVPSYSLFIPLQDTTYEMGATHVCPGTHLCSEGTEESCPDHNLAVSGPQGTGSIWPQGWGALVNQQTTHKGMGHFKEGGLDRVVIIATFAPRPQTHRGILETRMIGQGGSYSLLWSQWGHTFYDFVHAETRMTYAQKILRSLGVIKGGGWNLVTVASMRMANYDTGYADEGTLEEWLEEGGFWFLPKAWQGIESEETNPFFRYLEKVFESSRDGLQQILPPALWETIFVGDDKPKPAKIKNIWHEFLFYTVKRSEKALFGINFLAISTHLIIALIVDLAIRASSKKSNGSFLRNRIGRLFVTHATVCVLAFLYLHVVGQSNWARDIRNGKAFRLPPPNVEGAAEFAHPPSTIPLAEDILIAPQYASDYYAGYSRVVEFAHPGNMFWRDLINENAHGYNALTTSLKVEFCRSLIDSITIDSRRFLVQDQERFWTSESDVDTLTNYCHKELVTALNPITDVVIRQLEALRTECKFGRLQDKVIHKSTMPDFLLKLEDRLLPKLVAKRNRKESTFEKGKLNLRIRSLVNGVPFAEKENYPARSFFQSTPDIEEPFDGAWLQEGDVVEARYKCKHNEWYRGTIFAAIPNRGTYDIKYEDEDIDEDLSPRCVRRFIPYEIDEVIEVRTDDDVYERGVVVGSHGDDSYNIQIEDDHTLLEVPSARIRRFEHEIELKRGTRVIAQYNNGDEWFPGIIVHVREGNTYDVAYDDGDFEPNVHIDNIQAQL